MEQRRPGRWLTLAVSAAVTIGAVLPAGGFAATTSGFDVAVYGGTASGVLAAVTAARAGARVALIVPTAHIGGMVSSGLSATDVGSAASIGGYTREFFDRLESAEGLPYGRYRPQPHTAELVFRQMLAQQRHRLVVFQPERLVEDSGVSMAGTAIRSIRLQSGRTIQARVFIDASYEGDLMAQSGVSYRVGRESPQAQSETLAGVRPGQFVMRLPRGLRPDLLSPPPGPVGSADARIQDSNYRVCFSSDPANQTPFPQPAGYDVRDHEMTLVYILDRQARTGETPSLSWLVVLSILTNQKFDVNGFGVMSPSLPGVNWGYPEGTYLERSAIEATHRTYQQGFFWFLANDPRVPASIRTDMAAYGLCKDEFTDNGNWPWLLYLREGRRMVGSYVLSQRDIERLRSKRDVIAIASYRVDSHHVSRWVDADGDLFVEGTLALPYIRWAVPYRAITPKRAEVTNLLVPVAASATHVAQSSLRMEPQYMMLGEAAGQAAAQAALMPTPVVQDIDVRALQVALGDHGAYLTNPLSQPRASLRGDGSVGPEGGG